MTSYDLVQVPQTVLPDNRFCGSGPKNTLSSYPKQCRKIPTVGPNQKKHSFRTRTVREMTLSGHMIQQQGQIKFGRSFGCKKLEETQEL